MKKTKKIMITPRPLQKVDYYSRRKKQLKEGLRSVAEKYQLDFRDLEEILDVYSAPKEAELYARRATAAPKRLPGARYQISIRYKKVYTNYAIIFNLKEPLKLILPISAASAINAISAAYSIQDIIDQVNFKAVIGILSIILTAHRELTTFHINEEHVRLVLILHYNNAYKYGIPEDDLIKKQNIEHKTIKDLEKLHSIKIKNGKIFLNDKVDL